MYAILISSQFMFMDSYCRWTSHINCIVALCLINIISRHVPLSGHDEVAFLNDVANDAESTLK